MNNYSIIVNTYSFVVSPMFEDFSFETENLNYSHMVAGLAAFGTALQNYQAVALALADLAKGTIPATRWLNWSIQISALGAGGLCSGMVNFWMNVELLEDFSKRANSNEDYQYKRLNLTAWQTIQYFGGIFVFVVTGILFGLMAFTFAMTGPLAILSIGVGLFVAGIMTIQEVETWLCSYDHNDATSTDDLTNSQLIGKYIGHIVAIINVIALSLLFALSVAQALIALHFAAVPALIAGFAVAFTFGAFTEHFFYDTYLANFCQNFSEEIKQLHSAPKAWFAYLCVSVNALVNAALTYAGIQILTALLIATNIALPPVAVITAITAVLAFFAGSASFILGLDFKNRQNKKAVVEATESEKVEEEKVEQKDEKEEEQQHPPSFAKSSLGLFATKATDLAENSDDFKPEVTPLTQMTA